MVKERKLIVGTTNMTSTILEKNISNTGEKKPKNFYRSWSHKLISPDEYVSTNNKSDRVRNIENLATWRKGDVYKREFATISKESYIHPNDMDSKEYFHERSYEEVQADHQHKLRQKNALETFCALTKLRYGTTASMLKSVSVLFFYLVTIIDRYLLDNSY